MPVSWQMMPSSQVAALDLLNHEDSSDQSTDQSQNNGDALVCEGAVGDGSVESEHVDQSGVVVDNDLGILQADEGDEEADTNRNAVLQVGGEIKGEQHFGSFHLVHCR